MKPLETLQMRNRHTPQTRDELNYLVDLAQKGSIEARNKIVERNIGLVQKFAGRYWYEGLDCDDYFQEGIIGLMRAVVTYEPQRNLAFSTYAGWWIKQKMMRYREETHGLIRVPIYAQHIKKQFENLSRRHPEKCNAEIVKMIMRSTKNAEETVRACIAMDIQIGTLDKPSETGAFTDLEDKKDEGILNDLRQLDLDYLLSTLEFREYRIIQQRLQGIGLREIGEQEGISRERVRQIQEKAVFQMQSIDKLRRIQ